MKLATDLGQGDAFLLSGMLSDAPKVWRGRSRDYADVSNTQEIVVDLISYFGG